MVQVSPHLHLVMMGVNKIQLFFGPIASMIIALPRLSIHIQATLAPTSRELMICSRTRRLIVRMKSSKRSLNAVAVSMFFHSITTPAQGNAPLILVKINGPLSYPAAGALWALHPGMLPLAPAPVPPIRYRSHQIRTTSHLKRSRKRFKRTPMVQKASQLRPPIITAKIITLTKTRQQLITILRVIKQANPLQPPKHQAKTNLAKTSRKKPFPRSRLPVSVNPIIPANTIFPDDSPPFLTG